MSEELQTDVSKMTDEERAAYEYALSYAKTQIQRLRDPNKTSTALEATSFSTVSRENLIGYLKSPKSSERSIRNASISMYNASTQYKRLILYYALMPTWAYIIRPLAFDETKAKTAGFKKAFHKAAAQIEAMNLKHEMKKVLKVGLREGVFYGAIWQSSVGGSFSIQKINPDYCQLTAIEDGTWLYAVDMSRIREEDLVRYPPKFTDMWNNYKATGQRYQEVPSSIAFCFKADETTLEYSLPPFSASMVGLLDIENYKALQKTASEISNYKLLHMEIPLDSNNAPKFTFELADKYYQLLCAELPDFVGAAMSPMKVTDYSFDADSSLRDSDIVSRAERQFWSSSGSSSLLFGDAANTTAGALKLSIKADEEIVLSWVNQCERIVNRLLKNIPGTQKFQVTFLPTTIFNLTEMIDLYKNASTLGIPVKSAYSASLEVAGISIPGVDYIEKEFLNMDELTPLSSSYNTATSGEAGRPPIDDTNLTEEGIRSREDSNE